MITSAIFHVLTPAFFSREAFSFLEIFNIYDKHFKPITVNAFFFFSLEEDITIGSKTTDECGRLEKSTYDCRRLETSTYQ